MRALAGMVVVAGLALALAVGGCGGTDSAVTSTTAFRPGSLGTIAPETSDTFGAAPDITDVTLPPTTAGDGQREPQDPGLPSTTVLTGTTLQAGSQHIALTFVGPMTADTWKALRTAVNKAGADGDKVRALVAKLSAGPAVEVSLAEIDRFSGIGFGAGADTSQPVAAARGTDGRKVLVYAFTIAGRPGSTTIAGFDRETGRVGLVEGPLDITDHTKNITTVPAG